ncbi:mercuric transport protein MerTP [Chitinophaga alhagiae]|uniref:mercuric transport protein MerTP n=1 Tax=Chitinophaga alhagiae TaxID=2203219 RepID=UPI000E5B32BD|nr:mercuric transport protein MerTP [Chitinophaga alhagiae]
MKKARSSGAAIGTGLLTAIAASLCCITPIIAMIAGSSSLLASFSWLEPLRPYLIGISAMVLLFAWYQQLKPAKPSNTDCHCEPAKRPSFLKSTKFLGIITLFSVLMMTFPLYASVFYPKSKGQDSEHQAPDNKLQAKFTIQGMTCASCEAHVNNEISKVPGVLSYTTSFTGRSSVVAFDSSITNKEAIAAAIAKTGYKVRGSEVIDSTDAEGDKPCCETNTN